MQQNPYEEKLKQFLAENSAEAEHIHFENTVHSVKDACRETGAEPEDFLKTICMIGQDDQLVAAIVVGSYRASTTRVGEALKIPRPEVSTPEQALEKTGYLVGGIPPFGYKATFLIDPLVMEKEIVYVGGGAPSALTKISPKEILRLNGGRIVRIRS